MADVKKIHVGKLEQRRLHISHHAGQFGNLAILTVERSANGVDLHVGLRIGGLAFDDAVGQEHRLCEHSFLAAHGQDDSGQNLAGNQPQRLRQSLLQTSEGQQLMLVEALDLHLLGASPAPQHPVDEFGLFAVDVVTIEQGPASLEDLDVVAQRTAGTEAGVGVDVAHAVRIVDDAVHGLARRHDGLKVLADFPGSDPPATAASKDEAGDRPRRSDPWPRGWCTA